LLGSEEESALATDLKWDSLPARYGSRGTPDLGGGRRVLFDVGGVSECLGSCSGKDLAADREVGEAAHAWATRLYEKGTALEGAMRLRVSAALPTGQTAGEVYPLKLSVALTAVAASKDSPGSSLLVSDAGDVQSLRAMREALLGADGFRQLSVEEGGKAYQIAFRDALPFESENGAVPTPAPKLRQLRRRTWEQRRRALARRRHAVVGKPHERPLLFESGRWLRRSRSAKPTHALVEERASSSPLTARREADAAFPRRPSPRDRRPQVCCSRTAGRAGRLVERGCPRRGVGCFGRGNARSGDNYLGRAGCPSRYVLAGARFLAGARRCPR
jgi:hypothetical protein